MTYRRNSWRSDCHRGIDSMIDIRCVREVRDLRERCPPSSWDYRSSIYCPNRRTLRNYRMARKRMSLPMTNAMVSRVPCSWYNCPTLSVYRPATPTLGSYWQKPSYYPRIIMYPFFSPHCWLKWQIERFREITQGDFLTASLVLTWNLQIALLFNPLTAHFRKIT